VSVKAPLSGRVLPLEQVPDEVFSQGILGEGVGIEPTDSTVVAPADATVSTVMEESRHAVGLTLANGAELLIHVGMDTVEMKGDGFALHVKVGDKVRTGDKLITFDPDKIRAAGHPVTTAFVVTDAGDAQPTFATGLDAVAGQTEVMRF
ncbi:MAG: PTS glucose transporter subunit IIA, partial [Gemmiger sp.]